MRECPVSESYFRRFSKIPKCMDDLAQGKCLWVKPLSRNTVKQVQHVRLRREIHGRIDHCRRMNTWKTEGYLIPGRIKHSMKKRVRTKRFDHFHVYGKGTVLLDRKMLRTDAKIHLTIGCRDIRQDLSTQQDLSRINRRIKNVHRRTADELSREQ